jgi:NADPH-dependent curcumin reductase CurA
MKTREVHLVARPTGWPEPSDFAIVERELPAPSEGEVVVRNLFMSVDPYMRGRMNDVRSYTPPFRLGEAMGGGALGQVVESGDASLRPGDLVLHKRGRRGSSAGSRRRRACRRRCSSARWAAPASPRTSACSTWRR